MKNSLNLYRGSSSADICFQRRCRVGILFSGRGLIDSGADCLAGDGT